MAKPRSASNDNIQRHKACFPIRTVAAATGVNPVTLRAWERRYQLLQPQRTAKGHRLYSQADIELIQQITELLQQGMGISQAQALLNPANKHALNNSLFNNNIFIIQPHQAHQPLLELSLALCKTQAQLHIFSYCADRTDDQSDVVTATSAPLKRLISNTISQSNIVIWAVADNRLLPQLKAFEAELLHQLAPQLQHPAQRQYQEQNRLCFYIFAMEEVSDIEKADHPTTTRLSDDILSHGLTLLPQHIQQAVHLIQSLTDT